MRVIAGSARSLKLETLPGSETRPTTDRIKETLFNILAPELPGSRFLDCFSGSGGIAIEALSRGAAHAKLVEKNPRACAVIRRNLQHTHLDDRGIVIRGDIFAVAGTLEGPYDIVFLDPPYNLQLEERLLRLLPETRVLRENTLIVVEASLETSFSYVSELGYRIVKEKRYKTNQHIFLSWRET